MRPWQQDPWRWEDDAIVRACHSEGEDRWQVRTSETVLYPEGGGQPSDRGTLGGVQVLDVQQDDEGVVVTVDGPLEPGRTVAVRVDGARRFDHMQQHTGQHLLTAILHGRFGVDTTSFHLGPEHCAIELATDRFDDALRAAVSDAVHQVIREARPVSWRDLPTGGGAAADLAAEGVRSRHLPSDLEGPLRLVTIDGIDTNTCCGTHVSSTAQLQVVQLLGTRSIGARGIRLDFLVGGRALAWMAEAWRRTEALNGVLSTGPEGHVEAVARLVAATKQAERTVRHQRRQLAEATAAQLASSADRVLVHADPGADLGTLQTLASGVASARAGAVLLAMGDGVFLVAGPDELVAAVGPAVAAALDGRGGGARGRHQGRMGAGADPEAARRILEDALGA